MQARKAAPGAAFLFLLIFFHAAHADPAAGKSKAGAGVNAPPVSYTVKGKQYVAVAAGGNTQIDFKRGNSVVVFALP